MNSNNVLPTIDIESTALAIEWTNGQGIDKRVAFDTPDEQDRGGLTLRLWEAFQHTYLMGFEANTQTVVDRTIEQEMRIERDNLLERNQRQMDRIETLMRDEEHHLAVINSLTTQADNLTQDNIDLRRQLAAAEQAVAERSEERDAMSDSLNSIQQSLIVEDDDPAIGAARASVVLAYRDGYANAEQPDVVNPFEEGSARFEHWALGRFNRQQFNQNGQRIEGLIGQVRQVQDAFNEYRSQVQVEAGRASDLMIDQAERRGWCSDYEDFVDTVEAVNSIVVFRRRSKNWDVTFSCDVDPILDGIVSNGDYYDYDVDECATVRVHATVTSTDEEDRDAQIEGLKRQLMRLTHVNDVDVTDVEESQD